MIRFFILLLVSAPTVLCSQAQLGMRLERYAGMYGAALNPANTAFTPHPWEVSLFSADLFADNNYAFLENTSVQNALRNTENIISASDTSAERPLLPGELLLNFFTDKQKLYVVAQGRAAGPAVAFRLRDKHYVGLSFAARTAFSVYSIPEALRFDRLDNRLFFVPIDVPAAGGGFMSWGEIALHYSYRNTDSDIIRSFGVTPKLLLGYESAFARAEVDFQYIQGRQDTLTFPSANWEYALTTGNWRGDPDNLDPRLRVNGRGAGVDLGFAWAMPADDGAGDEDYLWRLGASLLDFGFVRFNRDAERHAIRFDNTTVVNGDQFSGADSLPQLIEQASQAFLGDPQASLQERGFTVFTPSALSLQADYRVRPYVYVGGVLVQRIPLGKFATRRPNTLALIPRFEHRWASVSVPVVLSDYQWLRVGLAARLAWLYLGTDNLGSFFTREKLTGADFYIGLKINGFTINSARKNKSAGSGHSRRNWRKIKCYEF